MLALMAVTLTPIMGEIHELQPKSPGKETKELRDSHGDNNTKDCPNFPQNTNYMWWWIKMGIYSLLLLSGQTVATILGRLYFDKGGKSKWMSTLVQTAGFPVLIPFMFISPKIKNETAKNEAKKTPSQNRIAKYGAPKTPSSLVLAAVYTSLGVFVAGTCMLYSIGLLYLPVSTYSLICASQIAFNAFFSYFLNSQKLTPLIINSIILLTISSSLLVFNNDSADLNMVSKGKYMIGFVCTVAASAGYALILSLTQLVVRKILRRETFRLVVEMIVYVSLAATCVIVVGLFASGEWKDLNKEMGGFKLGKLSYIMTLVWIAISWQVFNIGSTGLIFEVSSLFSNVISTLGLPIVPIFSVFIFHDKMDGVKVIAMLLAIWGFLSYVYQHYLDDKEQKKMASGSGVSEHQLL